MKKVLIGAMLAAGLVAVMAGPALAGEVTGNGGSTPIDAYRAGSICSFSGLNDDPTDTELFESGRVQSFGDAVQEAIWLLGDGAGASALIPMILTMGPGAECRGYASTS